MEKKYLDMISSIQPDQRSQLDSILIVDGLNCFLRAFSSINFITTDGNHIGGLIGFLKSIGYAIKQFSPTKVIITFDGVGSSNAKRNLFPDYKANRNRDRITNYSIFTNKEEENESINNQMSRLIQYLKCLPVSVIGIDGLEADDIIGYLANRFEKFSEIKHVTIMSADKDFLQLVSNKTSIYSPTKKLVYTPEKVLEEYKVSGNNFINYKVLLGDKSDNVPGVQGLGPIKLLKFYPELANDTKLTLSEIILKASKYKNEHKLFAGIVEREKQLEINEILMRLDGEYISVANKETIKEGFTNSYTLDKYLFNQMYSNDKLGDAIPNLSGWLNEVFNFLGSFNL